MDIQEFLTTLPGPNRFLMIMAFLLCILYFTYRNMKDREKAQEEMNQKLERLRKTIERKNTRIKEVHHRIKNNLQILSFMLEEEAEGVNEDDCKKKLQKCKARMNSVAMIHDILNESAGQEFLELKTYLERVVHENKQLMNDLTPGVDVSTDIDRMTIDRKMATTCGLIVNELMMNCYQHAFDDSDEARINVNFQRTNGHVKFSVSDNGSGGSETMFDTSSDSLGSDIVHSLVDAHLQGEIELHSSNDGTEVQITFPAVYGSTGD